MKSKNDIDFGYLTQKETLISKKRNQTNSSERMSCTNSSVKSSDASKTYKAKENYSFGQLSLDGVQEDIYENQESSREEI